MEGGGGGGRGDGGDWIWLCTNELVPRLTLAGPQVDMTAPLLLMVKPEFMSACPLMATMGHVPFAVKEIANTAPPNAGVLENTRPSPVTMS